MYSRIEGTVGISNGSVWVVFWNIWLDVHGGLGNMEGQLGKASILARRLLNKGHDSTRGVLYE